MVQGDPNSLPLPSWLPLLLVDFFPFLIRLFSIANY